MNLFDQDQQLASTDENDEWVHMALGPKPRRVTLCGLDAEALEPVRGPGVDALCPTCDVMRRAVA